MANQTVLFTVLPRGFSTNPATFPVSVFVSPRLQNGDRLGQFPDWLDWTGQVQQGGLLLTFQCGVRKQTLAANTAPLRPELWRAMFDEDTFVRSRKFSDYTDRAIFSYPARVALSVLKSTYQQAGLALALPDLDPPTGDDDEQRYSPKRAILKDLLSGLQVNWNDRDGTRLRDGYRRAFRSLGVYRGAPRYDASWLDADGTFKAIPPAGGSTPSAFRQSLAQQFGVYSHMPQGAPMRDNPPDFDKLIDFHQALSSLDSYPELLRALGLVFDFELPPDFVALTPSNAPGSLAVVDVPRHGWQLPTQAVPDMPPLSTAYLHFAAGDPQQPFRIFTTAPGVLGAGLTDLEVFGLLNLEPLRYGIAQVDLESGMHKATLLAESWQDGRESPSMPDHPEVFDETTTLPSLRSGGFSLYADARALRLARTFQSQKGLNADVDQGTAPRLLFAEDLTHGYRVDVWDAFTSAWHSLHRRRAAYDIAGVPFVPDDEAEGFTQIAASQASPDPANPPPNDLYLNESMARWTGWSMSVPFPGKVMTDDPDPANALTPDPARPPNQPATPFKMSTAFTIVPKSLPSLRFGRRYRFRLRPVDLAGNSMRHDDPMAALLAMLMGLPRDPDGFAYLRYEPVAAPVVVLRDARGVTDPGSQLHRLVIRTFNDDPSKDGDAADTAASDRFIVPPSTSVEVGERLGMFDTSGRLDTSAAMYDLIGARDQGTIPEVDIDVAGKVQKFPLIDADTLDVLPHLPDVLSRGAALRNLPGSPPFSIASAEPGPEPAAPLDYQVLADANPRRGSAALIGFGGNGDWQKLLAFRLALADGDAPPAWDPAARVLTVSLPKGTRWVVPLSSHLRSDDLKLMGVWQWLREQIEKVTARNPQVPVADAHIDSELIAHIVQRTQEGGHWMLTPPRLLTLVHAVKQPMGLPRFVPLAAQHQPYGAVDRFGNVDEMASPDPNVLQTAPEAAPTAASELATMSAWRKPGAPDAYLLGGLCIHAASTDKVELLAQWSDPFDDVSAPREQAREANGEYLRHMSVVADEIPVPSTREGYIAVGRGTPSFRRVAYYDADHDLLCFARSGDRLGNLASGVTIYSDAAPRHYFDDTRHHRVTYTARVTSRYREYFAPNVALNEDEQAAEFTRCSEPVVVDVPASARPSPPHVSYVVPTFGWQRQTQSNLKRSVRFGGGLRIYLDRDWYVSGEGELLGVTLYDYSNGNLSDREGWKAFVTQWGADPIWMADGLTQLPFGYHFPNRIAEEQSLSLPGRAPGRVSIAGFDVAFDYERQKWFADVTIDTQALAYTPFVRLVLARYQPCALPDAKLSSTVVADYIQLTPERSAVVTADPYHPRALRVTISGPAPRGPAPQIVGAQPTSPVTVPTLVGVSVQQRDPTIATDLGWNEAPALAVVTPQPPDDPSGLVRWTGTITFAERPEPGTCRLVIREHEYLSANYTNDLQRVGARVIREQPKRLIYAEIVDIDAALIGGPAVDTGTTLGA